MLRGSGSQDSDIMLLQFIVGKVIEMLEEEDCTETVEYLRKVCYYIGEFGDAGYFLHDLAHEVDCTRLVCTAVCKMFKKLRYHTLYANHKCGVIMLYKGLLRLHVYSCVEVSNELGHSCHLQRCRNLRRASRERDAQNA